MKKITLLIVLLFGTFAFAQCPDNNVQWGTSTPNCNGVQQTLTSCIYGGEYRAVNVIAGNQYTFDTCGDSDFDTQITVYGAGGNFIAYNDDFCGLQSSVTFVAGATEQIRVLIDQFFCTSNTTCMTLHSTCISPPPPNDLCVNAINFVGDQVISGTTINGTLDGVPFCGTGETSPSVWYTFTDVSTVGSPAMTVSTCGGAAYDTKISVYSGSCGALVCVGGNDDACGLQSSVTFPTDGSSTYYVLVHGFGGASGPFDLTITGYPPPSAPPIINCPADISIFNDAGVCGAIVNFADAVAIDPEDGPLPVTQTLGLPSGSTFPVGDTIVEFTATDSDGQSVSCQFTITVIDNEDPTITCPADVVADNDLGLCGANLVIDPPVIDDNCPLNLVPAAPVVVGPVTDFLGGGSLIDTPTTLIGLSPSVGGDVTIDIDYDGDFSSTSEDFDLRGPDGSQIFFRDNQSGDCNGYNDTFTVVQGIWDGWITTFGNDLTFTLLADPSINPGLCANNFYQLTATMGVAASATLANDYNGTDDASDFYPVGTTTVTWTLTDDSGNMVQCSFDVTVNDTEAPMIVCAGEPNSISVLEEFEGGTIPGGWSTVVESGGFDWAFGSGAMPGGADFPTNAAIFDDDAAGSGELDNLVRLLSPVYDNSTATTSELSFDYSHQDFAGSGEFSVDVWDGAVWQQILFVEVDTPPTNSGVMDMMPFANANFQVRFTYDDENDWAWGAGVDNFTFTYDAPATPFVVELDATGNVSVDAADLLLSFTDNCAVDSVIVGGGGGAPGSLTTLFASDNGGSLGGAVYFDVTIGPEDLSLTDLDINTAETGALTMDVYTLVGTYVGNEGNAGAWTLQTNGSGTGAGDDLPSNVVLDTEITLVAGTTYGMALVLDAGHGHEYTNGDGTNEAYSNADLSLALGAASNVPFDGSPFSPRVFNGTLNYFVGSAPSSTADFTCDDLGLNQVDITVTDIYGNVSMCIATVEVLDVTSPVLVCADVTIELDEDGIVEIDPQALLGYSTTTYNVITISNDNGAGEGFTDFTVAVTDPDTVSFDWDYDTADGPAWDSFGYLLNGVYTELTDAGGANQQSGNSGPINVAPGDVFGFRSYSADGLFGACTTTISNFVPGFVGQFDPANWVLDLVNSDGDAYFVEIPGGPLSFDACGITIWAVDITEVTCADIGGGGGTPSSITTLFGSDNGGSPGGAVYFDITVGPDDIEIYELDINTADPGAFTVDVYTLEGTYVGNEGNQGAWTMQATGSGTAAGLDIPSNAVLDNTITLSAGTSYGMALVLDGAHGHDYSNGNGSNENYDNGEVELSLGAASNVPFDGAPFSPRVWNGTLHYNIGGGQGGNPIVITVFASDASGNIASCQSTVTVVDLLGPEITCPEDQTHDPGPGNLYWEVPDYWANGEATATDNCTDPVTITGQDPAAGTLLPDGVYTVTITAEDEYGNVSTCTFELTIESILGLGDNELSNAIVMYPNPAREIVSIANSSNILLDTAMFYDVSGKLVSQIDLRDMQDEKVIDVSAFASGVYMVQITGEQSTVVKRLIKE